MNQYDSLTGDTGRELLALLPLTPREVPERLRPALQLLEDSGIVGRVYSPDGEDWLHVRAADSVRSDASALPDSPGSPSSLTEADVPFIVETPSVAPYSDGG